ncbi:L-aspartate oxidase [Actinomycetota bacterium]|nr:L-aspartate oxidase [Actinomycetota bacterium]MDA9334342.1 L-aspartate oxidase [Actinomycetota bacterium]
MSKIHIPRWLTSDPPGWEIDSDVIVIGSGVAGLSAAIHARAAGRKVVILTKAQIDEGSTRWAQGGIAAAMSEDDSPSQHRDDTVAAGAGLCNPQAVEVLVTEGPQAVRDLISLGANFDREPSGAISLTREGGHKRDRIAHAGGDATGAEISRALVSAVLNDPGIEIIENALALDLITDAHGATQGVTLHVMGSGQRDGIGAALAPAVILTTGGFGQVFGQTTNPYVSTGDGIALALRAGAVIADLEFVQFHPTVLWLGPLAQGQQPLVSEAVRGEGAKLLDPDLQPFMPSVHELGDLAPRDIVAKEIMKKMRAFGSAHVWLDGRALGADTWVRRFPTILASARSRGIDPVTDLIPVGPAQHYVSGGVVTDLFGRTKIPGLYAAGEVACTGVHGANRLASNSLLEGLVYSRRIMTAIASDQLERHIHIVDSPQDSYLIPHRVRRDMQSVMDRNAGVLRSEASLTYAKTWLAKIERTGARACTEDWESANLFTVSQILIANALMREETRGSHWREDYPESSADFQARLVSHRSPHGELVTTTSGIGI